MVFVVSAQVSIAGVMASGCAHQGAADLPAPVVEAAYVQARAAGAVCRAGDAACCAERVSAARASGDGAQAAHLWQEVALACPNRQAEAAAALAGGSVEGPSPGPRPHLLNVSYRPRLSPSYRLFWVSSAVGPHLLPAPGTGAQAVDVEVQAIRFAGTRPGPLLIVSRRFELSFEPAATVVVDIAEGPAGSTSPLELSAHLDKVAVPRGPGAAVTPPRPMPTARLEKAQAVHVPPLRVPRELGGLPPVASLRLCLDRQGELDTIRFLQPVNPRLAASLIDMYRDARHDPYRVNDLGVPSCRVLPP
jgi:hypothetical protein